MEGQVEQDSTSPPLNESMIREAIKVSYNDMTGINAVNIVYPDIEQQIHHEDVYQRDRLNKEIDVHDINIQGVLHLLEQKDASMQKISTAVIRQLCKRTIPVRLQIDSGANRSITPDRESLHDIKSITPVAIDGVGGKVVVDLQGRMKLQCDDDSCVWVTTYLSDAVDETIVSPTDIAMSG